MGAVVGVYVTRFDVFAPAPVFPYSMNTGVALAAKVEYPVT